MARFDHLVVAAADLAVGAQWLADHLGVPLAPGGRHAAMGTHNRLLRLGDHTYLELIAIDPEAPAPDRPRWFGLDDPVLQQRLVAGPQLVHWVAASEDLPTEAIAAGYAGADILAMSRGDFRWRITAPPDGTRRYGGLLPSLIQWDVPTHPARRLPESGCRLMKLEAFCREPESLRSALAAIGLATAIDLQSPPTGETSEWVAYLETPRGLVELAAPLG